MRSNRPSPLNYTVIGDAAKVDIDGFNGTTILEAKFVNSPGRSPFLAGSDAPDFIRDLVLEQQMDEFQRLGSVLADPKVPFNNLEVRVNDVRAVPYFQALIEKFEIPGVVRVVETKIPQGR